MGLESSIFMTRAVFISLILHAFVFFLMSFFLTLNPPTEVFPKIKIYFNVSAAELSGSESKIITSSEQPVSETTQKIVKEVVNAVKNNTPPKPEQDIVIIEAAVTETVKEVVVIPLPDSPGLETIVPVVQEQPADIAESEKQESSEQLADTSIDLVSDSVSNVELASVDADADAENGEQVNTPGINSESDAGNSDKADLEWTGGDAAVLRYVPDPTFDIPYNAILPDIIKISFIVEFDGTVKKIKIVPPGSGLINLDQQIRSYINSFRFDSFESSEGEKKGILHLNLKERGGGAG